MKTHNGNQNNDIILAKEFQQHLTKEHLKNGVIDQCKNNKTFMERKLIVRQYHVQDNYDVAHKDVRMYCNTNQFPSLAFCVPHSKPHEARGVSKHYHSQFDPKLGNGVCAIIRVPFVCVSCTSMIDKPWISGISSDKQERYKPIINCTYWPVLGPFENWNVILLSHKLTPYGAFDEIHQVVLDGISYNIPSLVTSVKYEAINRTDIATKCFFVIVST